MSRLAPVVARLPPSAAMMRRPGSAGQLSALVLPCRVRSKASSCCHVAEPGRRDCRASAWMSERIFGCITSTRSRRTSGGIGFLDRSVRIVPQSPVSCGAKARTTVPMTSACCSAAARSSGSPLGTGGSVQVISSDTEWSLAPEKLRSVANAPHHQRAPVDRHCRSGAVVGPGPQRQVVAIVQDDIARDRGRRAVIRRCGDRVVLE